MQQTTDPATRVAARLAAEIIKRADTLTARQVGTIAHALGIDPGCDGTLITPGTGRTLYCTRPAGHPLPHEWTEQQPMLCGVSWRERGLTGSPRTCTRPVGHDGPHEQRGAL